MKRLLIVALGILLLAPQVAQACNSITWTGAISTDWNTAGNWNPARVPLQDDDVIIPASKTVTNQPGAGLGTGFICSLVLNGTLIIDSATLNLQSTSTKSTLKDLTLTSTLQSAGFLVVAGSADFTGNLVLSPGQVSGTGTATLTGAVTVSKGNSFLAPSVVDNKGSITVTEDGVQLSLGNLTFTNEANASINLQGDGITVLGNGTFTNSGGIVKTEGSGTSTFSTSGVFTNNGATGSVAAQSGTLFFAPGGSSSSTGTFSASAGATLEFSTVNFTLNAGTTFGGGGTVDLHSGSWNVAAPITVNTSQLTLEGGQITGTSDLTVNSPTVTWSGSMISASGPGTKMTLGHAATMTITTEANHSIASRNLDIFGTVNLNAVSPGGDLSLSASTVTIEQGATLNIQTDNGIGGTGTINNGGTFEKTGGTLTSNVSFGGSFNVVTNLDASHGTVVVKKGTLNLAANAGGLWSGTSTVAFGATLEFSTGNYVLAVDTVFAGSGEVLLTFATWNVSGDSTSGSTVDTRIFEFDGDVGAGGIQGPGNLTVSSTNFTWTGGPMQGTGKTTISQGTLTIKNGQVSKPLVNGRTVLNQATTIIEGGTNLALGGGAIWDNEGDFILDGNANITDNGGGATFTNDGTVHKVSGEESVIEFTGTFENLQGAKVIADGGTLYLVTSLGTSAGAFIAQADIVFNKGTWTMNSGTTMTGTGRIGLFSAKWNLTANLDVETAKFSANAISPTVITGAFDFTVGSQTISFLGPFTRTNGTIKTPNAASEVSVLAPVTLDACTWDNSATVDVTTHGSIVVNNNAVLLNEISGKISLNVYTGVSTFAIQINSGTFTNLGTVTINPNQVGNRTQTIGGPLPWENDGSLLIPPGRTLSIPAGYTNLNGQTALTGATLSTTGTINVQGGTVGGTGTISGPVNNTGGNTQAGNGNQSGVLNLTAPLTQGAGSKMTAVIGGTAPHPAAGLYDQINSTSSMALGGTLNLSFPPSFSPAPGSTFNILNFASSSGSFASVVTPSPTCTAQLTTTATSMTVAFTPANVNLQISPKTVSVKVNTTQQFTDRIRNGCGNGVKWKVQESGGGTVTQTGLYTAPATAGTFHVAVTSVSDPAKRDVATVTVTALGADKVIVTPQAAVLKPNGTLALLANQSVTWTLAETAAGSITSGGSYTAPAKPGVYHVVASSTADSTNRAGVSIAVTSGELKAAYVTDLDHNSVSVFAGVNGYAAATGQLHELESLTAGQRPISLAISPQGKFLLSANQDSNDLSMFAVSSADGTLHAVPGPSFVAGKQPSAAAFDPSGNLAFVTNRDSDDVSIFSVDNNTGQLTFLNSQAMTAGDGPIAIAVHPNGSLIYVVNAAANTVQGFSYDAAGKLKPVAGSALDTGTGPSTVIIDAAGKLLFVTNRGSGDVSVFVIDAEKETLEAASGGFVEAGKGATALAFDITGTYLFVAHHDSNDITTFQINADTGDLTLLSRTALTVAGPSSLAMDPAGQYLYVTSDQTTAVTVLKLDVSNGTLSVTGKATSTGKASSIVVTSRSAAATQAP